MSSSIDKYVEAAMEKPEDDARQSFTTKILDIMANINMSDVSTIEQYMSKVRTEINNILDEHILKHSSGSSYAAIIMRYGSDKHIRKTIRAHAPPMYIMLQRNKHTAAPQETPAPHSKHAYTETYFANGEIHVGETEECPMEEHSKLTTTENKDAYKMVFASQQAATFSRRVANDQAEKENSAIKKDPDSYNFTK